MKKSLGAFILLSKKHQKSYKWENCKGTNKENVCNSGGCGGKSDYKEIY